MKAVFLDRDGVINADRDDYVKSAVELRIYPFAATSIARLNKAGYRVVVVSNQQGVAKGLISEQDLLEMQTEISRQVRAAGGEIDAFYYCRHLASEGCSCRKPEPGLLLKAADDLRIDLTMSTIIGDSERDLVAGMRAGCGKTILVLTGKISRSDVAGMGVRPDYVAEDLSEAVDHLLKDE